MNIIISILLIAIVILLIGIYNVAAEVLNTLKIIYQVSENTSQIDPEQLPDSNNADISKKE